MTGTEAKSMTLRLDAEQSRALGALARVTGMSQSDVMRTALDEMIDARRRDAEFQTRLRRVWQEEQDVLSMLS